MNNNNNSNRSEVIVSVVALVVSLVALLATFMQVLQQYYASAHGYSKCNKEVMGDWANSKQRHFRWRELRFEVFFEVPVFFVSPPSNRRGAMPDKPIYFIEGTSQSMADTWTASGAHMGDDMRTGKAPINTAKNDQRASWFILLYAIQHMEAKSAEWRQKQYDSFGPPRDDDESEILPSAPPTLRSHHTFTVALQRKSKSWDTMPPSVTRPYATTTMCHLIEMGAALGIYWKEFDRKNDRYRAEGNGFNLSGEQISDLGLVFSFQLSGKNRFGKTRVIPVDEIKELCFGYVPTIYRATLDQRRLETPDDQPRNLSVLTMASQRQVSETLNLIGCNNNTVRYFLNPDMKTSHLFPISFEIVGMLSRSFYIEDSLLTYIPNPTPDRWDNTAVSLQLTMLSYQDLVSEPMLNSPRNNHIIDCLKSHIGKILDYHDDREPAGRLLFLRYLNNALKDCDEILMAKSKPNRSETEDDTLVASPLPDQRQLKRDDTLLSTIETDKQGQRRRMVESVMRWHFQEVLRLLNEKEAPGSDRLSLQVPHNRPGSATGSGVHDPLRQAKASFDDMNAADSDGPHDRQQMFMEVYFQVVREHVVQRAESSSTERRSSPGPGGHRRGSGRDSVSSVPALFQINSTTLDTVLSNGSDAAQSPPSTSIRPMSPLSTVTQRPLLSENSKDGYDLPQDTNTNEVQQNGPKVSLADQSASHDDIWCTLVFRMICWLMLHDFHKSDVQINKSELLGSRLPVYIS